MASLTGALAAGGIVAGTAAAGADSPVVPSVVFGADGRAVVDLPIQPGDPAALWTRVSVLSGPGADPQVLAATDAGSSAVTQNGTESEWTSDSPLRLPTDVAHGRYPVAVDYRMPGGTVQHWDSTALPDPDLFDDRLVYSVTDIAADRSVLDYDHQTATVTATVTVHDPETGTSAPAGPAQTVAALAIDDTPVTTSSSTAGTGAVSLTLTPATAPRVWQLTVTDLDPAVATTDGGTLVPQQFQVVAQPVRVIVSPTATRLHSGARLTLSGTAQRLTSQGWVPLRGGAIVTTTGYDPTTATTLARGTTDAAGHFSYQVVARRTEELDTTAVATPLLQPQNTAPTQLAVPVAPGYSGSYHLDEFAEASFSGRVTGPCDAQRVSLQYSATGRSGWTTIASARLSMDGINYCTVSLTGNGYPHGYYRLSNPETDALLAHTTTPHAMVRTVTRIVSSRLTPARPYVNATITATGRLQQAHGSSWSALRSGLVELVFRPKGDTTYYWTTRVHTAADGSFTLRSKDYGDGWWAVVYLADSHHLDSQTKVSYVDAR